MMRQLLRCLPSINLTLARASHAASVAGQSSRGELHIRRFEGGEEGTLVGSVEGDDGGSAGVRAEEMVDGEQAAAVLNVLEVLVVKAELRGVVGDECDVEDVHCARRHELRAVHKAVGGRGAVELQTILNVLTMADSNRVRTCRGKANQIMRLKNSSS